MATIELYGREVIPRVRELLADTAQDLTVAPAPGDQSPATANAGSSSV
jgi:hypothetical protein